MISLQKRPLLVGTLLLTASGAATRLIGFFYRIYLSRIFGSEGMGLLQLVLPVPALVYAICSAGFHTAVSRLVSRKLDTKEKTADTIWLTSIGLSLPLALLCSLIIYLSAPFIAKQILLEERLVPYLRILACVFPFSALHACTNAFFYGKKKSAVPALSQLAEQCFRVLFVFLFLSLFGITDLSVVFWGMLCGELCGLLCDCLFFRKEDFPKSPCAFKNRPIRAILSLAVPTGANRLTLNLMQSFETIVLPNSLRLYGYSQSTALSIYGTLTGMALPFILFPNALTGSLAMVLLPEISSESEKRGEKLSSTIRKTLYFSLLLGMCFTFLFLVFGKVLAQIAFQNELAGKYLCLLAITCPFLYLNTTLSGILQGLGKVTELYFINLLSLVLRLTFVIVLVPRFGMTAYFPGLLISQALQCFLCCKRIGSSFPSP